MAIIPTYFKIKNNSLYKILKKVFPCRRMKTADRRARDFQCHLKQANKANLCFLVEKNLLP